MWPSRSGSQKHPLGSFCKGQRWHELCLSQYEACCGLEIWAQLNPGGSRDNCHIKRSWVRYNILYIHMGLWKNKHTVCGLHICPGSRAMSMVLSGRVMRNSSDSTSVPSSSQTRDRDTADRDSSKAWQTYSTHASCSGLMWERVPHVFNKLK